MFNLTALAVIVALVGGLAIGYFAIGLYASKPLYASSVATAAQIGRIVAGLWICAGSGFALAVSFLDADWSLAHLAGPLGILVLYGGSLGLGTYARLARHWRTRQRVALEAARVELGIDGG